MTVNRLCGSGFEAVIQATREIVTGEVEIVIAGGSENMSQSPFAIRGTRFGHKLGQEVKLEDTLWQGLHDQHCDLSMGLTAENLAERFGISRRQCDEIAIRSNQAWQKAQLAGLFEAEIAPVSVKGIFS